jgi:hypothetical protein
MPEHGAQTDAGLMRDFLRTRRDHARAHQLEHRGNDSLPIPVAPNFAPVEPHFCGLVGDHAELTLYI